MKLDPTELTGLTLIEKVLNFKAMTSDREKWSLEKQKNNEPRFVRLQQLQSLIALFLPECNVPGDLKKSIECVLNGRFIIKRNEEIYKELFSRIDTLIATTKYNTFKKRTWHNHYLDTLYVDLLQLKIEVTKLIDHNSGMIETSYPYVYSLILAKDIIENINLKDLDDFLWTVIDPAKRTFTKDHLIKNNNYPYKDLYGIDIDWM